MADEPQHREFKLSGAALKKSRASASRRNNTRKNRQEGGADSGALLQLAAQSAPAGSVDSGAQSHFSAAAAATANAMRSLGPNAIQRGGDNSGALMQLATNPHMGGPINSQKLANDFGASVREVLATQLGPAKAQQFGGRKQHGGDGIAGTIQKQANFAPTLPGAPEPVGVVSGVSPSGPAPVGVGGARRLVLAPPKRRTRIALKAKKMRGGSEFANNVPPPPQLPISGGATRKARKIHLRVKGVTSRLAKAKKAKKQAMNCPISEVRSKLEAAKVIKKGSKAPEAMLRNMYADLLITKKGL
jgi:hypothetical protein